MGFLFIFFCWVACSIAGTFLAERRGQGKGLGFALGLLFGPFGILWIACSIDDPRAIEESLIERRQAKRCVHCWSVVHPRAAACPFCQTHFP
jgi:hypothetical protein